MGEIKSQNWGFVPVKNLTENEMKKLKRQGKVVKCPTRKVPGWKNIRWGQIE